jgi:hypothetical protein
MAIAPLIEKSSRKAREPELIQIKRGSAIATRRRCRLPGASKIACGDGCSRAARSRVRLIEINLSGPLPRQTESWKPPEESP